MSGLRLPRILSDGAVLQRRKSIHIWGWDEAGAEITIVLINAQEKDNQKNNYEIDGEGVEACVTAVCDNRGRFDAYLPAHESGGPFELSVSDNYGNKEIVKDIMIGLVWFCTGQSNMELPITRVKDKYPHLPKTEPNNMIRTFKIVEKTSYTGPFEELESGDWKSVSKDTILNFSATGYFFAENLQKMTGQTVGFINASLGGSNIYSWMSREMLEGYDELLETADKYASEEFRNEVIRQNMENGDTWRGNLYRADKGISEHWESAPFEEIDSKDKTGSRGKNDGWSSFRIPCMFKDTALSGFIGSVWFRRKFDLSPELAGKKARLFLGTMVDSDIVYVNGQKVGETFYQYPPRKYDIPESLTREKDNTIVIRLCVETGNGRFTPGKEYKIFNDAAEVNLADADNEEAFWQYRIGAECGQIPPTDFISWKATGLYNAMTAPCHNYPVDGVIWYQGESNVGDGYDYNDFTKRMVEGYRKAWGDENLPFIAVQLPNFVIDALPVTDDWGKFRLVQNKLLDIPMTGLAVTIELGEDNDLHPVTKEPIGKRLSLWAAHLKYGYNGEYMGPVATSATGVIGHDGKPVIQISLSHALGIDVKDAGKGTDILDMYIVCDDGTRHRAETVIEIPDRDDNESEQECTLDVFCEPEYMETASSVQWLSENTYHGGLITNETGIPMGPFELPITERM